MSHEDTPREDTPEIDNQDTFNLLPLDLWRAVLRHVHTQGAEQELNPERAAEPTESENTEDA